MERYSLNLIWPEIRNSFWMVLLMQKLLFRYYSIFAFFVHFFEENTVRAAKAGQQQQHTHTHTSRQ